MGGGTPIPDQSERAHEFDRLEAAVVALADQHKRALNDNASLRRAVEERDRRIRALEAETLELNQRRRDVAKRIDDLLAQMDQLDVELGSAGE
ncbi:MAG TPA: hypothetical protein VKM54_26285 [Myxococcota bacterium]|nr:hypothetical protein [Myxococcota bacterium]